MRWEARFIGVVRPDELDDGSIAWRVGIAELSASVIMKFGRSQDAHAAANWLNKVLPLRDGETLQEVQQRRYELFGSPENFRRLIVENACAW